MPKSFRSLTDEYHAKAVSGAASFLSEKAADDLKMPFRAALRLIAEDTTDACAASIVAEARPLAAIDRRLIPEQSMQEAYRILESRLNSGEMSLPDELFHVIRARFGLLADALSGMLGNLLSTAFSAV